MNDNQAVSQVYEWARHKVADPYGFAVIYAEHAGDEGALKGLAREWQRRHIESTMNELLEKRQDLSGQIRECQKRLDELDAEE